MHTNMNDSETFLHNVYFWDLQKIQKINSGKIARIIIIGAQLNKLSSVQFIKNVVDFFYNG